MRIILFISFLLFSISLYPHDNVNLKEKYSEVLKKIKLKMNKIIRPAKVKPHAAVIGVRGNKYDAKRRIYWKTDISDKMKQKIKKDAQDAEKVINSLAKGEAISLSDYIKENADNYFINEIKELYNSIETQNR